MGGMQLPIVEYVVVDSKYNRGQNLNVKLGYKINTTRNNTTRNDVKRTMMPNHYYKSLE